MQRSQPERIIGRYALFGEIASGGMASVHLGRLLGPVGFSRVVAIKRLYPHLARDPEFVAMFIDEARLAARVQHPNVAPTLDVVALEGELFIVMEYVQGESLARLVRLAKDKSQPLPVESANAVIIGVLHGLHAAHEARGEGGAPLGLVHRDVSPQNILVGIDGLVRVVDFGIAMAAGRSQRTASGVMKGKLRYMAPEQIMLEPVDRRTDVYGASVVLWELFAGRRLFAADSEWQVAEEIRDGKIPPPSRFNSGVTSALDEIVLRGCARDRAERFATAGEMADALLAAASSATGRDIGRWVESLAGESISHRRKLIEQAELQPGEPRAAMPEPGDDSGAGREPGGDSGTGQEPPTRLQPLTPESNEQARVRDVVASDALGTRGASASDDAIEARDASTGEDGARAHCSAGEDAPSVTEPTRKTRRGGAFTRPAAPPEDREVACGVEPTSITATASREVSRWRTSPALLGIAVGALLAAALIAFLVAARSTSKSAITSTPVSATATNAVAQDTSAAPPKVSDEIGSRRDPLVSDAGANPDGNGTSPASARNKPQPIPATSAARPTKPPALPPACNPPYWVDANGDKHFRRECLQR